MLHNDFLTQKDLNISQSEKTYSLDALKITVFQN